MASATASISFRPSNSGADRIIYSRPTGPYSPPTIERAQFQALSQTPSPQEPPPKMENIMNRKADANSSLYQICINLKRRLGEVPGFEDFIAEMEQDEQDGNDATDPVTLMWNMLRRGFPLMAIYNALRPEKPLSVNQSRLTEAKVGKAATFKFLQACLEGLRFPPNECFLITDLYGSDTTGFVKVTKVVNRVLDILSERGLLLHTEDKSGIGQDEEPQQRSHRQHVINELVTTERDYVQHLEMLQHFKNQVEQTGAIAGDSVHDIFLNLNALLDFQRRFLIRVEQQNSLDENSQNWGQLFVQYQDAFKVYEPFLANQTRCMVTVMKDWPKLKSADISPTFKDMVDSETVLLGFLMKPMQRLTKYPQLLEQLRRKGGLDDEKQIDLKDGESAASGVLVRANEAIDREQRLEAVGELLSRVEDWKGHNIDHFGELMLYGSHTVLKGEGQKEVEREYKVYLFERILLCCKEINPNKPKNRLGNNKSLVDKKGKLRLQLKGRIFMQNVTDVVSFSKHGSHFIQIFWKGDPGVENFVIRFANEETMTRWRNKVEAQRVSLSDSARNSGQTETSATEFLYLRSQAAMQNPYKQDDGEEDDESTAHPTPLGNEYSEWTMTRNASSTSLRSRSTTNGSGPPNGQTAARVAPPRFPIPDHISGLNGPSLTVATNFVAGSPKPDDHVGDSYFSPTIESPASIRSSQISGTYPFPRQPLPNYNWTSEDYNKHNTAPAIGRAPSRDGQPPGNSYILNGRTVQRPSLPAMAASQTALLQLAQSRNRSVSTPDIHNPNTAATRRYVNGQINPSIENIPVPPIPAHMTSSMRGPVNRSQNNSPTSSSLSPRTGTQSPKLARILGVSATNGQYGLDLPQQSGGRSDNRQYQASNSINPSLTHDGQKMLNSALQQSALQSSEGTDHGHQITQLKVKIRFDPDPSHVTIVVPTIIKHKSLIDRIDSKMERISTSSIAKGTARLRYCDSDGDYVTIGCDEDVKTAIDEWSITHEDALRIGSVPDFELFWKNMA